MASVSTGGDRTWGKRGVIAGDTPAATDRSLQPSESVCSLFEKTMRINYRLGGFSSPQTIEHFNEARLVRITHG